jgi:hypothetical protein
MAYIGNDPQNQGFTPAIDYFNGNGVTVTFTLSRSVASVAQVIVAIDNVIQNPNSSFTVAGNAITFSSAPLSGTNNIWVEYTSLITTYQAISQDPTVIGDIRATGGYLAEGDFGNSFVDGAILDYVTGLGRITVGDLDGLTIYNGGTAARTALLTLASSGDAAIGTTSSLFATANRRVLAVNGTSSALMSLSVGSSTSTAAYMFYSNPNLSITNATTGGIINFSTENTERMRIDSSGNLLVGTTSAQGRLTVTGERSDAGAFTFSTEAQDGTDQLRVRCDGAVYMGLDGLSPYNLTTAAAANATLQSDGFLYRSTSSLKYKTDVQDLTHGLSEVLKLRPVTYKGVNDGETVFGGLIAEDVHDAGLTEFVQYAKDGTPDALAYGNMVSLAFKAIQEQQAIIEDLKARIETLEAK